MAGICSSRGYVLIAAGLAWPALAAAGEGAATESPTAAPKPSLLVTSLKVEGGVDEKLVRLLDELVLTEFQKSGEYKVTGASDIVAMLDAERQKQLAGCDTDTGCLAEIGGALGAEFMATSSIGRVGNHYLLNVKLINVRTGIVVDRWSEQIEGVEDELVSALRSGISAITSEETADERAAREATFGLWVSAWVIGGLAVATAVTGVAIGSTVESELKYSPFDTRHASAMTEANDRATLANVFFGISGAFAAASVVLFILDLTGGVPEGETRVVPVASPTGAGIIVTF